MFIVHVTDDADGTERMMVRNARSRKGNMVNLSAASDYSPIDGTDYYYYYDERLRSDLG